MPNTVDIVLPEAIEHILGCQLTPNSQELKELRQICHRSKDAGMMAIDAFNFGLIQGVRRERIRRQGKAES